MQDDIVVSVEMITYDQERYIAKALDSVLMQEVDFKYQIVVGEDCSTDKTREVLLAYQAKHPDKIQLVLHDKNVGMRNNSKSVSARSMESNSKYIALLEGDDFWTDPQKLQIQIDAMERYPDCYLSFHAAEIHMGDDESGDIIAKQADGNRLFSTSETILGGGAFCPTASIIYRRDLRKTLPDFYYDVPAGDYLLQILGSLHGGILYVDRVMSVYKKGIKGSWSASMKEIDKKEKFVKDSFMMFEKLDAFLHRRYHKELQQRTANLHYDIAKYYLYAGQYDKFRMNMEKSMQTYPLESKVFKLDFRLRAFPRLLKVLRHLKDLLRR